MSTAISARSPPLQVALANGVSIRVVSDSVGHSRTSITMDVYAHTLPSQERVSADTMDAAFG